MFCVTAWENKLQSNKIYFYVYDLHRVYWFCKLLLFDQNYFFSDVHFSNKAAKVLVAKASIHFYFPRTVMLIDLQKMIILFITHAAERGLFTETVVTSAI